MSINQLLLNLRLWIEIGENEEAKKVIEQFNLYNKVDHRECTLLHYAAQHGNLEITQYLLSKNLDVNAKNSSGFIPLMHALSGEHDKVAEALLNAGADTTAMNNDKKNSLHFLFARSEPNYHIVKLMLLRYQNQFTNKYKLGRQLVKFGCRLDQAFLLRDADIIKYMVKHGLPINYVQTFGQKQTTLHLAVISRSVKCVKVLCKYGADVSIRDRQKKTPMMYLYVHPEQRNDHKQLKILKFLLQSKTFKAEPSQLSSILMRGSREAIGALLRSNVDFNAQDQLGRTVLYYLAVNSNSGIVEELKIHEKKLNVNVVDKRGAGPLHVAAKLSNVKMLKYLLERGAHVNCIHEIYKCPPLFVACERSQERKQQRSDQCVDILLRYNADPQIVAQTDNGPISIFDILKTDEKKNRLQSVLAHLALLDKRGIAMTEMTTNVIYSEPTLKKYFMKYRRILKKKIARTATVFQLLTVNEKRMGKYLNKPKLVMQLRRIRHKRTFKSFYSYYFNTAKQRVTKGLFYKTIKDKVASVICQLLDYRFDESNVVIEKIIGYLDEQDIRQLYQMYS